MFLKPRISYVAFDVGNVLVHSNFHGFLKKLSKSLNITLEDAEYFMNRTQKLHDLGLTKMSDELRDHFKIKSPITIDELINDWNQVIQPADWLLDKLDEIVWKNNIQVAILSNVGLEHAERMQEVLKGASFFKNATKHFSCQVGARKPNLLYYHSFLQLHPEWRGCPYVDDLQENLDFSKQFGFQTYRFSLEDMIKYDETKREETLQDLENFIMGSNR